MEEMLTQCLPREGMETPSWGWGILLVQNVDPMSSPRGDGNEGWGGVGATITGWLTHRLPREGMETLQTTALDFSQAR